jgi:hypothetical protein
VWVFCGGMMRSGSTVQYQITRELVVRSGAGRGVGWIEPDKFPITRDQYKDHEITQLLVVKSHYVPAGAVPLLQEMQAVVVYSFRDIRDVVVSLMHKMHKSFWRIFLLTDYVRMNLKAYYQWTSYNQTLVSEYGAMTEDLTREVMRIANHLAINVDDLTIRDIANRYSLGNQVRRIKDFDYESSGVALTRDHKYHPDLLLHNDHIHSGKTGQWKTDLTDFQTGLIECVAYTWLQEVGYPVSQTWVKPWLANIVETIYKVNGLFVFLKRVIRRIIRW